MKQIKSVIEKENLKQKIENITEQIKDIDYDLKTISQIMQQTTYYWEGEAGELHQLYGKEAEEQLQQIIGCYKKYVGELREFIGMNPYKEKNVESERKLPDNFLK